MSRRVLVTGGASGLGAALAAAFVARGDQVLVTDLPAALDRAGSERTAGSGSAGPATRPEAALPLDVTSDDDWASAYAWVDEHWGGLDVLVNNAGVATGGRIDVVTLDEWRTAVDINLLGVVRGCRTFVPMLKRQGSGHIVNTASLAGLVHPPAMSSYTAVKAGVVALSETLSYELSPWGVLVSAVCPGFFRTNLASSLRGSDKVVDALAARLIERSPLTAEEVAGRIVAGIARGDMVVVPDRPARKAVWTKRFARPLYDREQRRFAEKIRAMASTGSTTERPGSTTDSKEDA